MPNQSVSLTPIVLIRFLRDHAWVWALPAVAGLLLAGFISVLTPRKWQASQGFIIRSEAAGYANQRLGKFTDLSEMKAVQETVLELTRSQNVIAGALKEVGPRPSWFGTSSSWPTMEDVVDFRDKVRITPPGGAEFGMTEVFYLSVFDKDPQRANQLASAVANQLERRLLEVRDDRAASMIEELTNGLTVAKGARDVETEHLAMFEAWIGADLAELRNLESPSGSQSDLGQKVFAIESNLRENETRRRENAKLLSILQTSDNDPHKLLAVPSSLLSTQPSLERLKGHCFEHLLFS